MFFKAHKKRSFFDLPTPTLVLTIFAQHAPGAEGAADQGADGDGDEPDDPAQLPDRQAPREGRQPPHRGQAARPGGREHFQVPQPLVLTAPVNSFN